MKLFKQIPCATAAFFSTTTLFGADRGSSQFETLDSKVSAISQQTVEETWGGRNSTTRPDKGERGYRLFATVDFLWWTAKQDGLEYAITSKNPSVPIASIATTSMSGGAVERIDFDWTPGFRLGVGYNIPYDQWDLYFYWTRLYSESDASAKAPSGGSLTPVWMPFGFGGSATSAKARWHLKYNIIDLELGRSFFFTKALTGRPFLGLRGAWISQSFHPSYNFVGGKTRTELHQSFHAAALRAGFNLNWYFVQQWSLFGKGSASLGYGEFEITQDDDVPASLAPAPVNVKNSFHTVKANVEAALGIQWDDYFYHDRLHLTLSAAYEFIEWFNQNQLTNYRTVTATSHSFVKHLKGDLSLQGLTLSARLDF